MRGLTNGTAAMNIIDIVDVVRFDRRGIGERGDRHIMKGLERKEVISQVTIYKSSSSPRPWVCVPFPRFQKGISLGLSLSSLINCLRLWIERRCLVDEVHSCELIAQLDCPSTFNALLKCLTIWESIALLSIDGVVNGLYKYAMIIVR